MNLYYKRTLRFLFSCRSIQSDTFSERVKGGLGGGRKLFFPSLLMIGLLSHNPKFEASTELDNLITFKLVNGKRDRQTDKQSTYIAYSG